MTAPDPDLPDAVVPPPNSAEEDDIQLEAARDQLAPPVVDASGVEPEPAAPDPTDLSAPPGGGATSPGGIATANPEADTAPPAEVITITRQDAPPPIGPPVPIALLDPNGEYNPNA